MTLQEFENLKEKQLITIKNKEGEIIDIFHYTKYFELRYHNYCGEEYYYLGITLCPRLEQISITTKQDIKGYYERKKKIFNKKLDDILNLEKEIK